MKQHLFILLFFTGVIPRVLSVPRKYYLIQKGKSWNDAQIYCRANHADLATIETMKNMIQIQQVAQSENFNSTAWIGLYNAVNSWRWSMGNEPLGSFTNWYSPNPDNWHAKEYCGITSPSGWLDVQCPLYNPAFCYDDTKTGTDQYIYISSSMTWSKAQSYCRQHYTDLVSVRNETESSVLQSLVNVGAWFGLFRDSWKWSDQTNFTTIPWAPGKPINALGNENCVSIFNGQASDEQCKDINPFFCYSILTGKNQIVRLKVQADQDVNDPPIKADILDKLRQILRNYGNVTVKWREQPDGLVFNKIKEDTPVMNSGPCLCADC